MSKSDENQNNIITLMDDPKVIMNKMKRAMTDSDNEIRFSEEKPGISNLLSIYCAVTGKTIPEAEREFVCLSFTDLQVSNFGIHLLLSFKKKTRNALLFFLHVFPPFSASFS